MSTISTEQPPEGTPPELVEYLSRFQVQVNNALGAKDLLPNLTALPVRPEIGKLYYFSNAIPAHAVITAEGYYGYKGSGTGWVLIV